MKHARIGLIVVVLFLLLTMANTQVRASTLFTFTKIADTSGPFTSFGSNPYSINIHGEVAFVGVTAGGTEEVHVGNGGPTRFVTDTSGAFDFFTFPPAVNDTGTVVYTASALSNLDFRVEPNALASGCSLINPRLAPSAQLTTLIFNNDKALGSTQAAM